MAEEKSEPCADSFFLPLLFWWLTQFEKPILVPALVRVLLRQKVTFQHSAQIVKTISAMISFAPQFEVRDFCQFAIARY